LGGFFILTLLISGCRQLKFYGIYDYILNILGYASYPKLEIFKKSPFISCVKNRKIVIEIDLYQKEKLMQGIDPIDCTLQFKSKYSELYGGNKI